MLLIVAGVLIACEKFTAAGVFIVLAGFFTVIGRVVRLLQSEV